MLFPVALLAGCASATNLILSNYNGNLTTLKLSYGLAPVAPIFSATDRTHGTRAAQAILHKPKYSYSLTQVATINSSTQSPSWLTYNHHNRVLYLMDEAMVSGAGTIVSYHVNWQGQLSEIQRLPAKKGGVSGTFFASGTALAVAHYASSSLQTYSLGPTPGHMKLLQTFHWTMNGTGPVSQQDSPHPHQAIVDPTGQYLLVPDLGADIVRVFSIDHTTKHLKETPELKVKKGSGPRHATFSRDPIAGQYILYLVNELSGNLMAFGVSYTKTPGDGMSFKRLTDGVYDTRGPGKYAVAAPGTGVAPAEIAFSPDGKFLIASNRRDSTFAPNVPGNPFPKRSDSIATWALGVKPYDGHLDFLQIVPAGGSFPRQFAMNKTGDLVAVGLQQSERVVVIERDSVTGRFGAVVASAQVAGNVTCVVWDE